MYDLRIINGHCYINKTFIKTNIYVTSGRIASINEALLPAHKTVDASHLHVLPGFIDPHVHLKLNVGEFTSADDFETGSHLAALGGVTTLIDFLDPIYENKDLEGAFKKRKKEAEAISVDYAFHCTLGNYSDNVKTLEQKLDGLGITSVKVFTTYSSSNRQCQYHVIKDLLNTNLLILAHAEDDDMIYSPETIEDYEASRGPTAELSAVSKLLDLLKEASGRLYIVHVSSGNTLASIDKSLYDDRLYLESCPQYFTFTKDVFLKEQGPLYLLAPPFRGHDSIDLLKKNIKKVNSIGTDHCSFTYEEKMKYEVVDKIPKGIGSLGLSFQIMYSLFGKDIIPKFTSEPARIFNLSKKGKIKIDYDADFAIIDFNQVTNPSHYKKNCDYDIYHDILPMKVVKTILRGEIIMADGEVWSGKGRYVGRTNESHH